MSALEFLNLPVPQQLTYNKGILIILCIKFLIIIPQITWHSPLLVTSPTTLTPGITSTCQGQGLTYLKLAHMSLAGASLWNSLPQNIKLCSSLPCFEPNLHKHTSENNLSLNLDRFVWITHLPKEISVVYTYVHERNLNLTFLHICNCRNYETALISCLIVFVIFVCGIVMFICVCSIGRTGC